MGRGKLAERGQLHLQTKGRAFMWVGEPLPVRTPSPVRPFCAHLRLRGASVLLGLGDTKPRGCPGYSSNRGQAALTQVTFRPFGKREALGDPAGCESESGDPSAITYSSQTLSASAVCRAC